MGRAPRPALPGPVAADVVGAGHTGLWTAYYLARAAPGLRIVVVEQRFACFEASGRNGGWLTGTITGGGDRYVRTHGAEAAHRLQVALPGGGPGRAPRPAVDVAAGAGRGRGVRAVPTPICHPCAP